MYFFARPAPWAFAILLAGFGILNASPEVSAAAAPSPNDIYRRAIEKMATMPRPPYMVTTQQWNSHIEPALGGNDDETDREQRVLLRTSDIVECDLSVPVSPASTALIGKSLFAPDVWLRQSAVDLLKNAVAYGVQLAGTENRRDGGTEYHLVLQPHGDPLVHSLRQLWVDGTTFKIDHALLVVNYSYHDLLPTASPTQEDFQQIGPYWLVTHVRWNYAPPLHGYTLYVETTAKTISFPASLPDWLFDAAAFDVHRNQLPGAVEAAQ